MKEAPWRTLAAVLLVGTLLFLWPERAGLLGDPIGETHNHLWYFAHAWAGLQADFPADWSLPLMDPPNLGWFALGWAWSPTAAWNLVAIGNVVLGGVGGATLGWVLTRSRAGACVGLAAVAWSPFLGGAIDFGVTEAEPLGWYALHLAAMVRLRDDPRPRVWLAAGATLGAFALTGWYHAAFALVPAAPLALWVRRREALYAGGLALLMVLPSFLEILGHLAVWQDRAAGLSDPTRIRAWRIQERYGIDLLRFGPSTVRFTPSYSVYVGVGIVGLAAVAGRRGAAWAALATPLYVLALGHWLRVGGEPVLLGGEALKLPAGRLVEAWPHARFVTHWYRAAGPASGCMAAAASLGAAAVERWCSERFFGPTAAVPPGAMSPASSGPGAGRRWLLVAIGPLLACVLLADSLALSSTRWPRVAAPLPVPPALVLDGPVLDLPVDDNRVRPEQVGSRRPAWMWQLTHRQPVTENYEGADTVLARSDQARALQRACGGLPVPRPGAPDAGRVDPDSDGVGLRALGVRWVVVHHALAPVGCVEAVVTALGAPTEGVEGATAWRLE